MSRPPRIPLGFQDEHDAPHRWIALSTLVLWMGIAMVGVAGPLWPERSARGTAESPQDPPPVEVLVVELTDEPLARPTLGVAPPESVPSPLDAAPEPSTAPPLARVVAPSVAVAFPKPTPGPSVEVARPQDAARSVAPDASSDSAHADSQTAPQAQALVYGRGEGRQPAPRYPRTALREGQEGAVTCVFSVEASGRVSAVEIVDPCPWPLLNEEAARVIRSRWRFRRGEPRRYQITINFQIQ